MRAAELLLSKTGSLGSGIVVTRRALDPEQKRAFLSKNAQTRSNPVEWSSELPQCDDLLLLFFAQDIVHLRVTRLSVTVEFLFDECVDLCIAKRFTVLLRNLNLWVCGGALPKPQGIAFPGHADPTFLSARLFPSSRCSASRDSCSPAPALSPAAFELRS